MNIETAYPSNFLKTADLDDPDFLAKVRAGGGQAQPGAVMITIADVQLQSIEDRNTGQPTNMPVVFFGECERGLILKVTNKESIVDLYGTETDDWRGRKIVLYKTTTNFGRKVVDCMRVRRPQNSGSHQVQHSQTPEPPRAAPQQAPVEPAFDVNTEVGATTGDGIPF